VSWLGSQRRKSKANLGLTREALPFSHPFEKIAVEIEGDEGKRLLFPLLHQRLFFLKGLLPGVERRGLELAGGNGGGRRETGYRPLGRSGAAGLWEINLQVPAGLDAGDPVVVVKAGQELADGGALKATVLECLTPSPGRANFLATC
jgi:hypothetical protein